MAVAKSLFNLLGLTLALPLVAIAPSIATVYIAEKSRVFDRVPTTPAFASIGLLLFGTSALLARALTEFLAKAAALRFGRWRVHLSACLLALPLAVYCFLYWPFDGHGSAPYGVLGVSLAGIVAGALSARAPNAGCN